MPIFQKVDNMQILVSGKAKWVGMRVRQIISQWLGFLCLTEGMGRREALNGMHTRGIRIGEVGGCCHSDNGGRKGGVL